MARLLVCRSCKVVHKMRDFDGEPMLDHELYEVTQRHLGQSGNPDPEAHKSLIMRVDDADVERLNEDQLRRALADKLDTELKEMRDDVKDQAMQCYNLHMRPSMGCIDWHDSSRAIGRTRGVPDDQKAYLCDFCPVSTYVEFKKRQAAGLYGKKG